MQQIVFIVNKLLAGLTLISDAAILLVVVVYVVTFFAKGREIKRSSLWRFLSSHGILFAFIVSLVATLGSLFYSEIAGYEPCKLCWYQRIFMYPQTILLGIAFIKKHRDIAPYTLVLSSLGGLIATYHYYLQRGGQAFVPCSTVGYSVSCAQKFVMEFGYITIPMMSLTAFTLIIMFMLLVINFKK